MQRGGARPHEGFVGAARAKITGCRLHAGMIQDPHFVLKALSLGWMDACAFLRMFGIGLDQEGRLFRSVTTSIEARWAHGRGDVNAEIQEALLRGGGKARTRREGRIMIYNRIYICFENGKGMNSFFKRSLSHGDRGHRTPAECGLACRVFFIHEGREASPSLGEVEGADRRRGTAAQSTIESIKKKS